MQKYKVPVLFRGADKIEIYLPEDGSGSTANEGEFWMVGEIGYYLVKAVDEKAAMARAAMMAGVRFADKTVTVTTHSA